MAEPTKPTVVYAVGLVDYDIREALPSAIYSTLDAAKAHYRDVTWTENPGGGWDGMGTNDSSYGYAIAEYELDSEKGRWDD